MKTLQGPFSSDKGFPKCPFIFPPAGEVHPTGQDWGLAWGRMLNDVVTAAALCFSSHSLGF